MAAELFNSLGGYSAGIPAVEVIDANGNVVTNVLTSGNVAANTVYATYYKYANGNPLTVGAAGSNTQLQFNDQGQFGGIPNVTWNGNILSLGDVSALSILGGDNGYFLQTDGAGNLTWAAGGNGGGNGSPGGANTQVQFNDSGNFGGDSGFTYDKNTNLLTVGNLTVTGVINGDVDFANTAGTVTTNAQPNITSVGTLSSLNVTNTVTANLFAGSGANLTNLPAGNLVGSVPVANYVSQAAQPNITSVGVLTSLTTSGSIAASGNINGGNISVSGTTTTANLSVLGNATISNVLTVNANATVNFAVASNVSLGSLSNIHISGGTNGYVLSTDGAGNLSWTAGGGGGNGTPGGSNTQIQYNDIGTFGGSPFFTFNEITNTVNIAGNLVANAVIMGSGAYRFSYSNVYAATTNSTSADQILYSIPVASVAGLDFTIISTDTLAGMRQITKLTSVNMGSSVNYVEVSSMQVNGYLGDFSVQYDAGNILVPPSIALKVTPATNNLLTHKMQITTYEP